MPSKVAIVTGANKGIGFGIVRGLCEKFQGDVYLTSRDVIRGENAVKELKKSGLNPHFHQLDISSKASVERFRDFIKRKHGGIDILVNNAAIAFDSTATEPFGEQADETIKVNYFGLVCTCDILFPILRAKARVVNLSSSDGHLSWIPGKSLKDKLARTDLTEPVLSDLMKQFVKSAKNGTNEADGWGSSVYRVSKVGVSALTFIQDREYGPKGIIVNCVHPGYVATDLTSYQGPLTIDKGSEAALYLALEAPSDLKGVYMWYNKKIIDWFGELTEPY